MSKTTNERISVQALKQSDLYTASELISLMTHDYFVVTPDLKYVLSAIESHYVMQEKTLLTLVVMAQREDGKFLMDLDGNLPSGQYHLGEPPMNSILRIAKIHVGDLTLFKENAVCTLAYLRDQDSVWQPHLFFKIRIPGALAIHRHYSSYDENINLVNLERGLPKYDDTIRCSLRFTLDKNGVGERQFSLYSMHRKEEPALHASKMASTITIAVNKLQEFYISESFKMTSIPFSVTIAQTTFTSEPSLPVGPSVSYIACGELAKFSNDGFNCTCVFCRHYNHSIRRVSTLTDTLSPIDGVWGWHIREELFPIQHYSIEVGKIVRKGEVPLHVITIPFRLCTVQGQRYLTFESGSLNHFGEGLFAMRIKVKYNGWNYVSTHLVFTPPQPP